MKKTKYLEMDGIISFLQSVAIFSLLSYKEIYKFKKIIKTVHYENEEILFHEGDEGNKLYIVKEGKVKISICLPDKAEKMIAQFSAGDFFGEMSIFENAKRSATCSTIGKTTLLVLKGKDFFKLIEKSPEITIKVMYKMLNITTHRLLTNNVFLSDMVHWGEDASKRAITDELTGVYNRRYLDEAITSQFETALKKNQTLSVIMVDLDHFREINELYTQKVGDELIVEVVKIFKKHLREKDIISRYGGDEFTVLLPNTNSQEALFVAERICREIEKLDILSRKNGAIKQVTSSMGISNYPEHADNIKTLKECADRALYQAKEQGRNRVLISKN